MASERLQRQIDHLLDEAEEAISGFEWDALLQRPREFFPLLKEQGLTALGACQYLRGYRRVG